VVLLVNEFIYDLTSYKSTLNSLAYFVKVKPNQLEILVLKYRNQVDNLYSKLINTFKIDINKIDISNLYLKVLQVTTNDDNCESIKKYGLLGTQEAINKDTCLAKFLKNKEIEIDFNKETIAYKGEVYNKTQGQQNKHLRLCFTKLFSTYHYPINGFIYSDNPIHYGDRIYEKPEIVGNLSDTFCREIEKDWIKNTQCFIIEFKSSIYNFDCSVFTDDKQLFEESRELVIKKWIIEQSLKVIHDLRCDNRSRDIYAYMNPNYKVEPNDIVRYIKVII